MTTHPSGSARPRTSAEAHSGFSRGLRVGCTIAGHSKATERERSLYLRRLCHLRLNSILFQPQIAQIIADRMPAMPGDSARFGQRIQSSAPRIARISRRGTADPLIRVIGAIRGEMPCLFHRARGRSDPLAGARGYHASAAAEKATNNTRVGEDDIPPVCS